jgi:tetratricopeptide (TPR) repeat protein
MTSELQVAFEGLPRTETELFGRDEELEWLDACWADGVHVASVVASGGVGKTALVARWLSGMRDKGWDGAARVHDWSFHRQGTVPLGSSDELIHNALVWFDDPEPTHGTPSDKGARLARLVRKERTLLILDGVEPLQRAPGLHEGELDDPALEALIWALAEQNDGLCLITSRLELPDLGSMGEDWVRTKHLGSLSPEAGAELLKARGARGADEELRQAAREYEGHALALALLGSYLEEIAKGDILRRREIGPPRPDERQGGHARRVMTAHEGWLGKPEIAILRMIGLLDRPMDVGEIEALRRLPIIDGLTDGLHAEAERRWYHRFIAPPRRPLSDHEWAKSIANLQRAGLLSAVQGKRLDAHPLVREHFGEQLKRDHVDAWREGHRRLYVHLKEKAKPLPDTLAEMAPLHAAVVHGCLAGKNQEAIDEVHWKRIMRRNEHFSTHELGAFGSEVAVLSAFFDPPWERLVPGLSEPYQAFVFSEASSALQALGRLPEATGLRRLGLERDLAQARWKHAAHGAFALSDLLMSLGELGEAVARARKSVELGDTNGDAFLRMTSRVMLAWALHATGRREEAAAQFEDAERMQKEREPARPLLYSLMGLLYGDLLLDQGLDAQARERAEMCFTWHVPGESLGAIALDHLALGRAHLLAAPRGGDDDLAQATSHLEQAVDGLRRAGQQAYLPLGLLARAALRIHTRDFAAARHDLDVTLTLSVRRGLRLHEADAHLGLARLALAEHTSAPAREHLAGARRIVHETGYHRRDGELTALDAEAAG